MGAEPAIRPVATYAPWNLDPAFTELYRKIAPDTLVDRYRCWELWTLVEQVAPFEGALLEVGVWRGGTGALLAHRARDCGIEEPVYLCDTFRGVVKAGAEDSTYRGGEYANTSREHVEALLRDLALENAVVLEGVFPDETAERIAHDRFRLCHIDVDVYRSARDVLNWVWERMVVGGVVVYDDYGFEQCDGITKHVDEQRGEADRLVFHNLNGHGLVVKLA